MMIFRIQTITIQVGAILTVPISLIIDIPTGITYFFGVCFSVLYLILLGKETDNVGIGKLSALFIYRKRQIYYLPTAVTKFVMINIKFMHQML